MAFTFGFYNSLNGDRKYNAFEMSKLFDGIILDGVFEQIGQHFAVTAGGGMSVNVGTGRAWLNHTWNENDAIMPLNLPESDLNRSRYDAVVIEVGDPNTDRTNAIKIVSGTPAVNPSKPVLNTGYGGNSSVDDETLPPYQHALAYILVGPGVEEITNANIEIVVGMDEMPFVTGPVETRSIEELFNQWDAQFSLWFTNLKAQLTENVVTNLQNQIDQNRAEIEKIKEDITNRFTGLRVERKTYTDIITESKTWTNPRSTSINVSVLLFGGGGGCASSNGGGGGGGYMTSWTGTISANASIPVTIGNGGDSGSSGGTTSFGTYCSAAGGTAGNNGGSGGTGGGGFTKAGGSGSYGGGGGGSGGGFRSTNAEIGGYSGGSGGIYGGGGGGGGILYQGSGTPTATPGSGASGGTYGGKGGNGGIITNNYQGYAGNDGTNTTGIDLEFVGTGTGGSYGGGNGTVWGYGNKSKSIATGGGGGGGGYGGNGGSGGSGDASSYAHTTAYPNVGSAAAGPGGGGGGYGASGGNGRYCSLFTNGELVSNNLIYYGSNAGGGGGGGYGGKGGDSGYSGEGYGSGAGCNESISSGYERVTRYSGGGGGGYGKSPSSISTQNGRPGVCIIRYTVTELIIDQQ